jgi:hypothetical protein
MFFDEITLKRSGWYTKVLYYVFPGVPKYNNFCPFFWLTILALLLFLPKTIIKSVARFVDVVYSGMIALTDYLDTICIAPYDIHKLNAYGKEEIAKSMWYNHCYDWEDIFWLTKCERKKYSRLYKWFRRISSKRHVDLGDYKKLANDDSITKWIESRKLAFEAAEKRKLAEEEARRVKIEQNRKFFASLVKYTKWVVPVLCIPAIIFAGYHLFFIFGWVFYWIWYVIVNTPWLSVLIAMGVIAVVIGIITLIVVILSWIFDGKSAAIGFFFCKLFTNIGKGLCAVGRPIRSVFSFFWLYFKTFKENNCPAIKWED